VYCHSSLSQPVECTLVKVSRLYRTSLT
jgi:hypothetical protein